MFFMPSYIWTVILPLKMYYLTTLFSRFPSLCFCIFRYDVGEVGAEAGDEEEEAEVVSVMPTFVSDSPKSHKGAFCRAHSR